MIEVAEFKHFCEKNGVEVNITKDFEKTAYMSMMEENPQFKALEEKFYQGYEDVNAKKPADE